MKKSDIIKRVISLLAATAVIMMTACASSTGSGRMDSLLASAEVQKEKQSADASSGDYANAETSSSQMNNQLQPGLAESIPAESASEAGGSNIVAKLLSNMQKMTRPSLMAGASLRLKMDQSPSVPEYKIETGLKNVEYADRRDFTPAELKTLEDYGFVVMNSYNREFFETYESNRYMFFPNFVTVDSMMHLYHIYFAYLMKNTEKSYLADELAALSGTMLSLSMEQYDELLGTEWESAAKRNVGFFAVGAALQSYEEQAPYYISDTVDEELRLIEDASGISVSPLTGVMEDYSQYIPRGYYSGDPELESYFKTMMWYGRMNFSQNEDDLDRSAFLMTLAMDDPDAKNLWETIYVITSFFAGTGDDNGYYEYLPVIKAVFEDNIPPLDELAGSKEEWELYHAATAQLPAPAINSVPTFDSDSEESTMQMNSGFRFMGQRFSIDASIFQQLIYRQVGNYDDTDKRMLPDVLDVMSAFGSKTAYDILDEQGDTKYAKYTDNMNTLRESIAGADDDQWNVSLYSSWLNTLRPLTEEKGEGYPFFMTNKAWAAHNLETFAGSYSELKHDTVLYSKQVMAEMGDGGMIPEYDDRGYVEPEPEVFYRLSVLTEKTRDGLESYGMLSAKDKENLNLFRELADQLKTIALKELQDEVLTEDEYELIRTYGGNLEHLWKEVMTVESGTDFPRTKEFPAAVIADIATDPNGSVLEAGDGNPGVIYVIVPVDGRLVLASGTVYTFYQFEWPMNDRLTDNKWRQMLGIEINDSGKYEASLDAEGITNPKWTQLYRSND